MSRSLGRFLRNNAIALLALFLALGGTSFAAATLINGKQIKPHTIAKNKLTNKAIKQLKGNRGPRGLQGAQGAQGVQGAQGIQGIQGIPGPFPQGNLPAGITLKGSYLVYNNNSAAGEYSGATFAFPFQIAAPLTALWVPAGGSGAPHCAGSSSNPTAGPGYLCIYETQVFNQSTYIYVLDTDDGSYGTSGRWGFGLFIQADAAGNAYSMGNWAATPASSASAHGHSMPRGHSPLG